MNPALESSAMVQVDHLQYLFLGGRP